MSMVNDWFQERMPKYIRRYSDGEPSLCIIRERLELADGFSVSVQASHGHYATPRETGMKNYEEFELGYPDEKEDLIMPWAEEPKKPTETVYGYVPAEVIDKVIEKHGGIDGRAKR